MTLCRTASSRKRIVEQCKWHQVEVGLEVSEMSYQPHGYDAPQRSQQIKRRYGPVAATPSVAFPELPVTLDRNTQRPKVHHTLSTLDHQVLAVGALCDDISKTTKQTFHLAVARKRMPWFEGLWVNAGEPVRLTPKHSKS